MDQTTPFIDYLNEVDDLLESPGMLLGELQVRAPVKFDLLAYHLDQAQPGHDVAPLREWLERRGIPGLYGIMNIFEHFWIIREEHVKDLF